MIRAIKDFQVGVASKESGIYGVYRIAANTVAEARVSSLIQAMKDFRAEDFQIEYAEEI